MEKLKKCPFCGNKPRLEHTTQKSNARDGIAELSIYWKVICGYCGCFKDGGYSAYHVNDEGKLVLCRKGYEKEPEDARLAAINRWNERLGDQS